MSTFAPEAVPALPLDALREAMGQADLDGVFAILEGHDRAVREALPGPDALLDPRQVQAWMNLIAGQQALMQELAVLRDRTADQLRQLQRHRSGASAYARAMG
ncbi:MAG TPA: hypothetical protein VFF93_09755 [Luteimonas sp.]|nr:hypothetical protein [Luteimonas sp.]